MKAKRHFRLFHLPVQSYYYYLAIFACMLASVILIFLYQHELNLKSHHAAEEKLQLIISDLENHLTQCNEVSVGISLSGNFRPEYLSMNKFRDTELLAEFAHYHKASPLCSEIFLFYDEKDYVYRSTGFTTNLQVYIDALVPQNSKALSDALHIRQNGRQYLFLSDQLIILQPIRLYSALSEHYALLGFVTPKENLISRFNLISGGLDGKLELSCNGSLLFTSGSASGFLPGMSAHSVSTQNHVFHISYQSSPAPFFQGSNLFIYIILLLLVWGIVMIIAALFANRAKHTLMSIPNKYRDRISSAHTGNSEDILTEIQFMIEQLLVNNAEIKSQMQSKQAVLRDQIVYNLMHGEISYDAPALQADHFDFPGPCYYAGCIAFSPRAAVSEEQYDQWAAVLTDLTNEETNEYIYAIHENHSSLINFICSSTEEQKSGMSDYIHEIASSFGNDVSVSIGPTCYSLSEIHNSWLRSNDLIYAKQFPGSISFANITYDPNIQRMLSSVSEGNTEAAFLAFNDFFDSVNEENKSVLLMQKIYIQFANEMVTLSNTHRIELNYQEIHSVITAKEHPQFLQHAHALLKGICEQRRQQIVNTKSATCMLIHSYICNHFTDYDISIEKVAQETNTTPSLVRSAVHQESGFLYRDYIVHLRLEYAKKLLLGSKLNIADICAKTGYANTSYFVRLFRENTGVTPSKFRQINGGS